MKKNVLLIASLANSLTHFRGDFILELKNQGYSVYAAAPDVSESVSKRLSELGATYLSFNLDRTGLNPFKDIKSIIQIKNIIIENNIDLVFPYTIKPVVYGSIAANLVNVPIISLITGLGFTFSGASKKAKFLQKISKVLYKYALRKNRLVIFQNKDDLQLFKNNGILQKKQDANIVNGSGVNLDRYPFRIYPASPNAVKFVIVARLIKEKGIKLFMDTAIEIKKVFPLAEFHIIGYPEDSPSAIAMEELQELHNTGVVVYHGRKDNVPDFLKEMHVFVLPTYYREGIPRSILEALSIGMPIITTSTPGCRETVLKDENGILIPPKNLDSLIKACNYFLDNPDEVIKMGKRSRKMAEEKFDVRLINQKLLGYINSTLHE